MSISEFQNIVSVEIEISGKNVFNDYCCTYPERFL